MDLDIINCFCYYFDMFLRHLEPILRESFQSFRSVYIHGPRQAGKTTLCRACFPDLPYASLENPDLRAYAHEDPRGFLARYPKGAILDEVQREPSLLSYLQEIIDLGSTKFVLTGSQNLLLMENVSQSLAGRIAILQLQPLSRAEIERRPASDAREGVFTGTSHQNDLWQAVLSGGFPEPTLKPEGRGPWLDAYIATYLERDVRSLLKVQDLALFQRFLALCAGRCGQLLNIASLSSDSGVSQAQCRRWLSILQASELVFLLAPHHENLGKRLIKAPKLYFTDTALVCRLLGVDSAETLARHPFQGALFETFAVNELRKGLHNRGIVPREFFWRDKTGHEVDYLLETGGGFAAFECKAGRTLSGEQFRNLAGYAQRRDKDSTTAWLVHGGEMEGERGGVRMLPWWKI